MSSRGFASLSLLLPCLLVWGAFVSLPAASGEGAEAEAPVKVIYRPEFRGVPLLMDALNRFGLEGAQVEPMGPWLEELKTPPSTYERVPSRLALMGSRAQVERLGEALARLDSPVPAVAVGVTVAEVRRRFSRETGGFLSFERVSQGDSVFRGTQGTFEPESWLRSQLTGVIPFQGTSLSFGRFEAGESIYEHVLRALAQDHDAEILARTTLVAGEASPARLESLVRVPSILLTRVVRGPGGTTDAELATEPVEAGLTFELSAVKVSRDGAVLDLSVTFTTAEPSPAPDAPPGELVLRHRRLETRITARDGESLVVGGLSLTRNLGDRRSMPLLDQVPALDVLISADGDQRETTELIFVLTPRVLGVPEAGTPTLAPVPPGPPSPAAPVPPGPFRGPYGSG